MRFPFSLLSVALLCSTLPASAARPVKHKATSSQHSSRSTHATSRRVSSRGSHHARSSTKATSSGARFAARAPMDSARATEIQTALIRSGYLQGEPTGSWDASSTAAMQKLQSDNGWQTKIVPDSRALIKLGLGPGATPTPPQTPNP